MIEVPSVTTRWAALLSGWRLYYGWARHRFGLFRSEHPWLDGCGRSYWEKRTDAGVPPLRATRPCRDIVLTGLNIRDTEGNLTGAYLRKARLPSLAR